MPEGVQVKICGITEDAGLTAAVSAGAAYIGLVFFARSPRCVDTVTAARLARALPNGVRSVGLFVDPDDATLTDVLSAVPLDMIQLHGEETPERVAEVRAVTGLPVMKAIGLAEEGDLSQIDRYEGVADRLLIDTKAPPGATRPGGNGTRFDWRLLAGRKWHVPWMLAGGLTAETVSAAVAATGAPVLDVSSGVERARGVKDPAQIRAFLAAAAAVPEPA
ncbi:MAG: phosphoribosylanthranilate isomerase [Pseudomonadota bacterium]